MKQDKRTTWNTWSNYVWQMLIWSQMDMLCLANDINKFYSIS